MAMRQPLPCLSFLRQGQSPLGHLGHPNWLKHLIPQLSIYFNILKQSLLKENKIWLKNKMLASWFNGPMVQWSNHISLILLLLLRKVWGLIIEILKSKKILYLLIAKWINIYPPSYLYYFLVFLIHHKRSPIRPRPSPRRSQCPDGPRVSELLPGMVIPMSATLAVVLGMTPVLTSSSVMNYIRQVSFQWKYIPISEESLNWQDQPLQAIIIFYTKQAQNPSDDYRWLTWIDLSHRKLSEFLLFNCS